MHPLFAQLLGRRPVAPSSPLPAHRARMTLPPSREAILRSPIRPDEAPAQARPSGQVIALVDPARPLRHDGRAATGPCAQAAPAGMDLREAFRVCVDPRDHKRVRISGSMREVCAALDALVAVQ